MKGWINFPAALAEWCNGGSWETHYTTEQKAVWTNRANQIRKHPDELDLIGLVGEKNTEGTNP